MDRYSWMQRQLCGPLRSATASRERPGSVQPLGPVTPGMCTRPSARHRARHYHLRRVSRTWKPWTPHPLDDRVDSPVFQGSAIALRSGLALRVDVTTATGTDYVRTDIEGGIALADAPLRAEFAAALPGAWERTQGRRASMADDLQDSARRDVLPFSNIPASLPPFLLRPGGHV